MYFRLNTQKLIENQSKHDRNVKIKCISSNKDVVNRDYSCFIRIFTVLK
jgi:hypothetical protein